MTDTEPAADSALRRPHSDLHPADATDDLTGNTEGGGAGGTSAGETRTEGGSAAPRPAKNGPSGGTEPAPPSRPDLLDDAAELTDGAGGAADASPGDGTVGSPPPSGDVDAMRTAAQGREAAAARADSSDTTPTPTETHGG